MKKFLIAAAAIATLTGAAGAASAQTYGAPHRPDAGYDGGHRGDDRGDYRGDYRDGPRGGYGAGAINAKQERVALHIARGERSGALDRREARGLRIELAQVADMERRFRASRGLDRREIGILNTRLDRLDATVVAQMREDRGGPRGGYDGGYGGYGDRDGRDHDRDGRR
jgi:hypothetical protein